MSSTMPEPDPQPTPEQLDELDALLKRMLELPINVDEQDDDVDLARELQELKADLTTDTQELSETEDAYQANLRQAKVAQKEFEDKIHRLDQQMSQVKIKEAQAEAASALGSVAFTFPPSINDFNSLDVFW